MARGESKKPCDICKQPGANTLIVLPNTGGEKVWCCGKAACQKAASGAFYQARRGERTKPRRLDRPPSSPAEGKAAPKRQRPAPERQRPDL